MNNAKVRTKHVYEYPFIQQLLMKYALALLAYAGALLVFIYAAYRICAGRIWYDTDAMWQLLHWVHENIMFLGVIVCLGGWLLITIVFAAKVLGYFTQVIMASKQMVEKQEEEVQLPANLKNVEDELNHIREQAIRNAYLAKEAEQRKNDLIVYLAHDLKTPLTSVIGYLTLLRDEPQISEEMREKYTNIALNKAERLEMLINEFFEIARFNLTTMTLDMEQINLSMMLEQIVSEFMPILAEKNLECKAEITPNTEFLCDADKLERVLDNLMRNAINYSYPNTTIYLMMRRTEGGITIRLRNKGKTIAPEKLKHIFEQFYRLDSSRATATGGAGLGLAISKEIVELHGGTIEAESEEESILFTVFLPDKCQKIV